MKSIDRFNIGLIIICTIIYIILCYQTKYKNILSNYETDRQNNKTVADNKMLYITTVYGFIYGALLISFQQRYLTKKITSLWAWVLILFVSILFVFFAFYAQIYTNENPNSFVSKFSYSIVPILPSLVILAETAISEVLEHGFNEPHQVNTYHLSNGGSDFNREDEYWYNSDRST
jgi:glucan phosphoethanolaminetransferase (alkaline phosphatase superfamily)